MPTTIRLKRVGRKKQSAFRIVVTDSARAVSAPSIERLGVYNPRTQPSVVKLDAARTLHWLREGAEPTDTVRSILRQTGVWEQFHAGTAPEELEEAVVLRGPAPGQQKTSPRPRAGERERAEPRTGTAARAAASDGDEAPVEKAAAGEESLAEEHETGAAESVEPEETSRADQVAGPAKGGGEKTDQVHEASAVPVREETEAAAPPVPEEEEEPEEPEAEKG